MAQKKIIKEGKWKCTAEGTYSDEICGQINPGPALMCEKCHSHRPHDVEFFLDENSKIVTDESKIEEALAGVDWKCYHCNYDNKADDFHCVHCGKLRNKDEEEWLGFEQDYEEKEYTVQSKKPQEPKQKKISPKVFFGGVAIILAVIFFFLLRPNKVDSEITGFSWEREIEIELYQTVIEEGWELPSGGRELSSEVRQNGTKEVYSHTEYYEQDVYEDVQVGTQTVECGTIDKGNGYFETQYCEEPVYENQKVGTETVEEKIYTTEPVYDTWYKYEIDKWLYERSVSAKNEDHEAFWPTYELGQNERAGPKHEEYIIELDVLDEDHRYQKLKYVTSDHNDWMQYQLGQKVTAIVKGKGKVERIKPLK